MIDYLHAERSSIKRDPITQEYRLGISGKGGRTYAIEKVGGGDEPTMMKFIHDGIDEAFKRFGERI
jgi:hypothetical protein